MVTRKAVSGLKSGSNNEHAKLSPSSASQWKYCPASIVMKQEYPDDSGAAAREGTAMHTLSEVLLNSYIKAGVYDGNIDSAEKYSGEYVLDEGRGEIQSKRVKGAILITSEMCKMVDGYVSYVLPILHSAEKFTVEKRINLTRVLGTGDLPTFGTADLEAVIKHGDNEYTLIILDLKTGRIKVQVNDNDQLTLYALGSLERLGKIYNITRVRLAIYQPYAGGASECDIGMESMGYAKKSFYNAAQKALDALRRGKKGLTPDDFKTSVTACKWCRHNEKCAAALGQKMEIASVDLADKPKTTGTDISMEDLAAQYNDIPRMEAQIAQIKKAMYKALLDGKKVPGYKIVNGNPGQRKWTSPDRIEQILKEAKLPRLLIYSHKLVSPTEAEKRLAKDYPEVYGKIAGMITRDLGGPVITSADDERPEYTAITADDLK